MSRYQPAVTLTNVKSFIFQNHTNLFVKFLDHFDGSVDMVMPVDHSFTQVKLENPFDGYTNGIPGAFFVGGDRYSEWSEGNLTGYKVYNCCGSFIVATKLGNRSPKFQAVLTINTSPEYCLRLSRGRAYYHPSLYGKFKSQILEQNAKAFTPDTSFLGIYESCHQFFAAYSYVRKADNLTYYFSCPVSIEQV